MYLKNMKNKHLLSFLLTAFLFVSGCSTIKLVGDYDEKIDIGITSLQKSTEAHMLAIEESKADYASTKEYYEKAKVEVSSLRVRADATERNSLTVRMLDKLLNNIKRLELAHKDGISPEEVKELFRGGFNSQFTAILTFELAKKRGETPDSSKAVQKPTPVAKSTDN